MRHATLSALVFLSFSLLCSGPAAADSLVCPKGIVSTGDRKLEVLKKCGEPEYKDEHYEGSDFAVKVDEWFYTINRWPRLFVFRNGVLTEIVLQP